MNVDPAVVRAERLIMIGLLLMILSYVSPATFVGTQLATLSFVGAGLCLVYSFHNRARGAMRVNLSDLPIRTTSRHEDDIVPVVYWFFLSHAAGYIIGYFSQVLFELQGVTGDTTVMIVGGSHATEQTWALADYYAMQVQAATFLIVFGLFMLRNRLR